MLINTSLPAKTLRKILREQRNSLTVQQQKSAATHLFKYLSQHKLFMQSRHIALYLPNDGEIDPSLLLDAARKQKKHIYLPVLQRWPKYSMVLQQLAPNQSWQLNRFGIKEPKADKKRQAKTSRIDLILMPLVGFDRCGNRLGMGGGFYDRYLAHLKYRKHWKKPLLIGLAHHSQQVDKLTSNNWDIPLSAIVTDKGWVVAN